MESELFCPRCNLPLTQVRMSNGLFWACDTCGGRAGGLELLRRTFTPESINPLWLHAINGEGKTGCRCPSCAHAMLQVALSENAGVNVDVMPIVSLRLVRYARSGGSRSTATAINAG